MKNKSIYTLVYQGRIANVFEEVGKWDGRSNSPLNKTSRRERLMQNDFRTCEAFCHGLEKAGAIVRAAWCNEAGDIKNSFWHFSNFDKAPFSEKFSIAWTPVRLK